MKKNEKSIALRFGKNKVELFIPNKNLVHNIDPLDLKYQTLSDEIIVGKIKSLLKYEKFKKSIFAAEKVLIAVDDHTRSTPVKKIIPFLIKQLICWGIRKKNISFFLALGTHNAPTNADLIDKFGEKLLNEYSLIIPNISETLEYTQVIVNDECISFHKSLFETDCIIGIGNVVPHDIAGYSGGAKIIVPGGASAVTTGENHIIASRMSVEEIISLIGNPENDTRKNMEKIAKKIGLKAIINTVLNRKKEIIGLFCGHPVIAHRQACQQAGEVYRPQIKEKSDIVIVSSWPCDIDYWQAIKAYCNCLLAVKKGGTVVLLSPCYKKVFGNATHHCQSFHYANKSVGEINYKINDFRDKSGISTILLHAKLISYADLIIYSDHIDKKDAELLNAQLISNIGDLQKYIYEESYNDKKFTTINCGSWVAPIYRG